MAASKKQNKPQLTNTTLLIITVVGLALIALGWRVYSRQNSTQIETVEETPQSGYIGNGEEGESTDPNVESGAALPPVTDQNQADTPTAP